MDNKQSTIAKSPSWNIEEITAEGERVTHLYPNDCYYAHLAVYCFASQFCKNRIVLDAGSGAGYGTAYLADHGARDVIGIELNEIAVAFSQQNFQRQNLLYKMMNLQIISGFPACTFDLIFSSNVLEHVPNVLSFFKSAWQIIKPDGKLLITVPPITREMDWEENIANKYHLNIWTPRQWFSVINQFFEKIQPFWIGFNKPGVSLDFHNTPGQCSINEKDFVFTPVPLDYYCQVPSLGILFVAEIPLPEKEILSKENQVIFVDNSFTRPPLSSQTIPEKQYFSTEPQNQLQGMNESVREGEMSAATPKALYHKLRTILAAFFRRPLPNRSGSTTSSLSVEETLAPKSHDCDVWRAASDQTTSTHTMVIDEHFVPELGLTLEPYIKSGHLSGVHHLIRYHWAIEIIRDAHHIKSVIDVACGAGYGSYMLAKELPQLYVVGVDYDASAVSQANKTYALPNLEFKIGSAIQWEETIGTEKIDCIISFDTIEHVIHREIMMEKVVNFLKEDGFLLLSTPCGSGLNLAPQWEYHKIEYSAASLYDFLKRYFHVILRPDDHSLPHMEVFNCLVGTGLSYLLRMNPVICREPIIISNPYLKG